jgi:hypothetical protein
MTLMRFLAVMAGLDPAIHETAGTKPWMTATSPVMTNEGIASGGEWNG